MEVLMATSVACVIALVLLCKWTRWSGKVGLESLATFGSATDTTLTRLYGVIATVSILGFAFFLPPFGVPDEHDHFRRAAYAAQPSCWHLDQVGYTTGSTLPNWHTALKVAAEHAYQPRWDTSKKLYQEFLSVEDDGSQSYQSFTNTAVYPATFYLPQALVIVAGKLFHAPPYVVFYVARLVNGLCGLALAVWALQIAQHSRVFMFACLLLPMSLHQMASLSPDATLIPAGMLFVAYYERFVTQAQASRRMYIAWLGLFVLIATSKIPLVALATLLLAVLASVRVHQVCKNQQAVAVAVSVLCVGVWTAYIESKHIVLRPDLIATSALHRHMLLHAPWEFLRLTYAMFTVHARTCIYTMVGALGRNELLMPQQAIAAGQLALVAGLVNVAAQPWRPAWFHRVACALGVFTSIVLMFAVFYITWTSDPALSIEGVQGRYFLYMAGPLAISVAGLLSMRWLRPVSAVVSVLCGVFSLAYVPWFLCGVLYLK